MPDRTLTTISRPGVAVTAAPASVRVEALDLARLLMAFMVVGAHARMFVEISYPVYFFTFVGGWLRIIIPIFLMTSGFFFAVQVKRGVWGWVKRLLVLHLIWSTIYIGVWMPMGTFSLQKAAFWYFFGAGHLWFMPAMIGGGLMLYWLRGMSSGRLLALAAGLYLCGGVIQYAMDMVIDFETVKHHNALYAAPRNFLFYGFPFMALGYLLSRDEVRAWVQRRSTLPLFLTLLVLLMAENWVKYVAFSHEAIFELAMVNFPLAPMVFAWLLGVRNVRAAWWMAPLSAAIYFVHALVLLLLEPVLGLSPTPLTLVAIVVSAVVGYGLVRINNKPIPLV